MAEPAVPDISSLPAWMQAAATLGIVAGSFLWWMKGKMGDPTLAISQTRAEATETFVKETQANRDVLLRLDATMNAVKEMLGRVVIAQEEIVRMMREDADNTKIKKQFDEMLDKLEHRERRNG